MQYSHKNGVIYNRIAAHIVEPAAMPYLIFPVIKFSGRYFNSLQMLVSCNIIPCFYLKIEQGDIIKYIQQATDAKG